MLQLKLDYSNVTSEIASDILKLLNTANEPIDIAGAEPQIGPIWSQKKGNSILVSVLPRES